MTLRTDPEKLAAWQARSRERAAERAREQPRKPLTNGKRVKPVNAKRRRALFARQFHSDAFIAFTRMQPSAYSGAIGTRQDPIVVSHSARSRGAGGTWRDTVPLLRSEHEAEHRVGVRTFWGGRSPQALAREHVRRWFAYAEAYGLDSETGKRLHDAAESEG